MNNIRIARMSRGMQQKELTDKLGVANGTLSKWERGVNDPDGRALLEMSRILGYSPDYLLGIAEEAGATAPQLAPTAETPLYLAAIGALMRDLPEEKQSELVAVVAKQVHAMRAS
jgi:transcriptional regulator with XRE-family HTH domain